MIIKRTDHTDSDFQQLVAELDKEFWVRYPDEQQNFMPFNYVDDSARVLVAYEEGNPVGCGCFRPMKGEEKTIEVKRMYVAPDYRSLGIGKKILNGLEAWAIEQGFVSSKLETGVKQPEAVAAYTKSGYARIPNFPPYIDVAMSICMMKKLV